MEPADWANLDALALSLILDKLEEPIDHIWFGGVCKSWRSVAKIHHQNQQFKSNVLPPMLMFHTKTETNLYSIPGARIYSFQSFEFPMPQFLCCDFHHGWFATSNYNCITLRNPFKNAAPIHFPPPSYERLFANYRKIILSSDPITSANDYVVAAIDTESRISFIRAGQKCWTFVNGGSFFTNITFYKGLIYAVNQFNRIVSFDPSSKDKIISNMVFQGNGIFYEAPMRIYLVESLEGDLWIVRNFSGARGTLDFEVDKLEQNGKLARLKSLEDNVLFVDNLVCFSVSASCFFNCLQKDSIYYLLHSGMTATYFKTYNVKDGSSHHHTCGGTPPFEEQPFTCWVQPPFQWN